jgi:hypothetical protein
MIWKTAALGGASFGLLFAGGFSYLERWLQPHGGATLLALVVVALVSGMAFGVLIAAFAGSAAVARQTSIALPAGETVEHSGPANRVCRFEACGGELYLTNRNLIFRPHRFNLQNGGVSIPRSEIEGVSKRLSLGVIPNGLLVRQRNGGVERFAVRGRREWLGAIARPPRRRA